jgi:CBS domain-containing protein
MKAKDVMTEEVVSVREDASVPAIARLLLERRISAVPVTDAAGRLVGIVSEGDLIRRPEAGTARRPSWWLELLQGSEESAAQYIKSHGLVARDIMTPHPSTVTENTALEKVASLLEQARIKRVPVVRREPRGPAACARRRPEVARAARQGDATRSQGGDPQHPRGGT